MRFSVILHRRDQFSFYTCAVLCCILIVSVVTAGTESDSPVVQRPVLITAAMCEDIQDHTPINDGVVFSIAIGKISCYSSFEQVFDKMAIYHNWYYRDELSTKIKLLLIPPRWSTFSTIQLREADKGPWRVEITDADGQVFKILRFSVTD